jgi:hypothetical protein
VTDCPSKIGKVTTEIISLYTTICPVTAASTPTPSLLLSTSVSTVYETKVYTITSCDAAMNGCASKLGSLTTETMTSLSTLTLAVSPVYSTGVSTLYKTIIYTITADSSRVGKVTTETLTSYSTTTLTLFGDVISTPAPSISYSTGVSTIYVTKTYTVAGGFSVETLTSYTTSTVTINGGGIPGTPGKSS